MADVTLEIGGRRYDVTCRDGEEPHLRRLGELVDAKAGQARAAVGGLNEVRQLLLAALFLADELVEARSGAAPAAAVDPATADAIERLAARAERLAERLESAGPNA